MFRLLLLVLLSACLSVGQSPFPCDKPRNAGQPFCDSSLPFATRIQSLISSLTLDEKIGLLDHDWKATSQNVELDEYNWWNEALHGIAWSPGTQFREPTPHATAFPQIVNLASSFDKELFSLVGNATGNEGRVFANVGNSGLTFWSPNINIYRDPRWGRGHETPGEDPYVNKVYAKAFVKGLEGDKVDGYLKTSACIKHFAAHSLEEDRFSFNSIVTEQDLADTYLPAFRAAVEEAGVSCVMCAYNAINGIPSCAHKDLLTGTIRSQWGFDGYIVSDCYAVTWLQYEHNYTNSTSQTCRIVMDAGMDLECGNMYEYGDNLRNAINDGTVPIEMVDNALFNIFKVLMRLGYFEKEATRPFKDFVPAMVDSQPHQALALQAARESIVLLKNAPNAKTSKAPLPIDPKEFAKTRRAAGMAAIGPHAYGQTVYLGNYHGNPSFIRSPADEIRAKYVPDLGWAHGCDVTGDDDSQIQAAVNLAQTSDLVILFVGLNATDVEYESQDRHDLFLTGLQPELIRRVLDVVQEPVILFVVSGGGLDLTEYQNDPRVGAIIWAGYLGQSAGEAMADVMFGNYNPSGRLTQTFYKNDYIGQIAAGNMNMRPVGSSPGRTYRFFTGSPLYPFGFGLSYTSFEYTFVDGAPQNSIVHKSLASAAADCDLEIHVQVRNIGSRTGDHSVLWYLAPPNAGQLGRPIKSLVEFHRVNNLQAGESAQVSLCLTRDTFQLANEQGEFQVVSGQWKLLVGSLERTISVV